MAVNKLNLEAKDKEFLGSVGVLRMRKNTLLAQKPRKAREMWRRGREHVLRNLLITKHFKNYLNLFIELSP